VPSVRGFSFLFRTSLLGQPGCSNSSKQETASPASHAHKGTRFVPTPAALLPTGAGSRNLAAMPLLGPVAYYTAYVFF